MAQHAPGPWRHDTYLEGLERMGETTPITVYDANGRLVAQTMLSKPIDQANARLMAAAPALLRAARELIGSSISYYEHNGQEKVELRNDRWVFAALLAAVAETEGEYAEATELRRMYPEPVDAPEETD